ncbi:FAD/NAD(P)-binding protein [Amycolatopsis sp. EV170708-02-1]|uniref:FAD/NAD(P)-binding protein n=1 Tax=Amycolatopsis sp. EV170708-02-1 TaxID=2919322 RepID=UPI001F0BE065|nr:FAD/NAD(P)-binding protein [Amycolatopsis sp. EV170708-02-1]UMO99964.1 FAD/NAD(P)-binding protein [Amycolatopsis sp. EV170708-02-1]
MGEMHHGPVRRVTVIGAGFSGTLTATRLLQFADTPLEICVIERNPGARYGGIAFGEASTTWDHMLNIQAGRITLYRERAEDFLEWANHEADRSRWPLRWKYHAFGLTCVVPRRIYGQYLAERLHSTAAKASSAVSLLELTGTVVDVRADEDAHLVQYVSGDEGLVTTLRSDFVVFATGHLEPVRKSFYDPLEGSDRFIVNPYSASARGRFASVRPDESVLLVGSGLTAFDSIVSLVNAGHEGQIQVCSRAGYMHATYPADHQHDIWQVRRPPFLDAPELTADDVVDGVRAEYEYLRGTFTDTAPQVLAERIMKAWEPYVIEVASRLDAVDVRALLDKYKSLIVANRTSTVPEIGDVVRSRMKSYPGAPRTISQLPGDITGMALVDDDTRIRVAFADRDPVVVDRVINCLGNTTDYATAEHPLWRGLVGDRGQAIPHAVTGRGIEVRQHGQLTGLDGAVSDRLFCVGPMRQGDETTRRGRLGAFVFSIGTLRNQCFDTATEIVRQLRTDWRDDIASIPDGLHEDLAAAATWLTEAIVPPTTADVTAKLTQRLQSEAADSLVSANRSHLTATDHDERVKLRGAIDDRLTEFAETLSDEFGFEGGTARRLTDLLDVMAERHVVHTMCDITRLSEWQSPQYLELVKTFQPKPVETAPPATLRKPAR